MGLKTKLSKSFLGATLSMAMALPSHAIMIDSDGLWQNALPGNTTSLNYSSSATETSVSWGNPTSGNGQSSYTYEFADGSYVDNSALNGAQFSLGFFEHNNNPVTGTAMSSIDLLINFDISDDDTTILAVDKAFSFDFSHIETPNSGRCNPTGATVCPDVVSVSSVTGTDTVNLFGTDYVIDFYGFVVDGNTASAFVTEERQNNRAELIGQLRAVSVPEPGSLALMGLSLFGIAGLRRRAAK